MRITMIFVIKDREEGPTINCINSLVDQNCKIIVVDYGSSKKNLRWERKLFRNIKFIEVKRNTKAFNISRGYNIGLKASDTEYVCFGDIDCIYPDEFIERVEGTINGGKFTHPIIHCLRSDYTKEGEFIRKFKDALGSCICIERKVAMEMNGFDEFYKEGGEEDYDFINRAIRFCVHQIWTEGEIKHQGHEPDNRSNTKKNREYRLKMENGHYVRNLDKWGEV